MSKFYLCVDLINPKTKKIETCYLLHEELEALLKFTSYCNDSYMLLNTFPKEHNIKDLIANNLPKRLDNNTFYFKKTKDSNPFNVIYKQNDDLLYTEYKDVLNIMLKNGLTFTYRDKENDTFLNNDNIVQLYESLLCLITDKKILQRINDNFWEKYDFDKNPSYRVFEKVKLSEKVAYCYKNLEMVLKYIFEDPYKKLYFLSNLKRLINKRLVSDNKYEKYKDLLNSKLNRRNLNYEYLADKLKQNMIIYFDIKEKKEYINPKKKNKTVEIIPIEDDFLTRYENMLGEVDDPDDLMLYIDAQKSLEEKNRKK